MSYYRLWSKDEKTYRKEFYYKHLDCDEQRLYENILEGILDRAKMVEVRMNISTKRISDIYFNVLWDNPHICYVNSNCANVMTRAFSKSLQFDYLFPTKQCQRIQDEFQGIVEGIVQKLDLDGLPDFEKELFLHDYMVENLSYDYDALQKGNGGKTNLAYSAYGAVMNKKAVCQGIAAMFKILADISGLQSIFVMGTLQGGLMNQTACPHAWNLVCIEGKYAHLDVTNDLNAENGRKQFSKFNFNDECARKTYSWEDRGYPKCESMQYYYYEYLNLTVHSVEELKTYVRRRKDKHSFEICLGEEFALPEENIWDFVSNLIMQELSKYVRNAKVEFEWIPDVRIIHVCR